MTTFDVKGVSGEVREMRGADIMRQDVIRWRLESAGLTDEAVYIKNAFAACVIVTDKIEGLSFVWPKHSATPEELFTAFRAWDQLPAAIISAWTDAIDAAANPVSDPATAPDANQKN